MKMEGDRSERTHPSIQLTQIDTNQPDRETRQSGLEVPQSARSNQISDTSASSAQPSPMRSTVDGPLDPYALYRRSTIRDEKQSTASASASQHQMTSSHTHTPALPQVTNTEPARSSPVRERHPDLPRSDSQYSDLIPVRTPPLAPNGVTEPYGAIWVRSDSQETLDDRPSLSTGRDGISEARGLYPGHFEYRKKKNETQQGSTYVDTTRTSNSSPIDPGSMCGALRECFRSVTG